MNFIYKRPKTKILFPKILVMAVMFFSVQLLTTPSMGFGQEETAGEQIPAASQPQAAGAAKISLGVKGMDVVDVLKILSDEGGFNLSINGGVTGRVTLFLKDIDVWDALEIVLISANLAYEANGEVIYVMTERDYELKYGKKYWDKREVGVFTLKYANISRARELLTQMVSGIGKVIIDEPTNTVVVMDISDKLLQMKEIINQIDKSLITEVFTLNYLSAEEIEKKLTDIITKDVGTLRIDVVSNKVIVVDYPEKIKEIKDVLEAFDEKPLQVLIDAKIIELSPSKKFYSGISWDYWIKRYFETTGVFNLPYSTTTDKITFGTHESNSDVTGLGQYAGMIQFLQMFGRTTVLSSPRILVLNNQEAKILVGTKDVYITSTVSEVGESAVTSQSVNFVDVGVKLYVTPTINRKGYVTLKIRPEISSSERTNITSEGQTTQVPVVTTSEAETTLIVKEGVSILLGGLRKITQTNERKQTPFLGSVPLLGNLFKSRKDEWTKTELVIILTPRIISGDMSIEQELRQKMAGEMWETDTLNEFAGSDQKVTVGERRRGKKEYPLSGDTKEIDYPLTLNEFAGSDQKVTVGERGRTQKKEYPLSGDTKEIDYPLEPDIEDNSGPVPLISSSKQEKARQEEQSLVDWLLEREKARGSN